METSDPISLAKAVKVELSFWELNEWKRGKSTRSQIRI